MKICPSCNKQNPNREENCLGCKASLEGVVATPEPPVAEWEQVKGAKDGNVVMERTRVPQGWLVAAKEPRKPTAAPSGQEPSRYVPVVFVPDPEHKWLTP